MKLSDIRAPKGANRNRKRVGRGHGSGWGKTAARGHGGLKSRSGGSPRPGFEGGQMPLNRRLPKFGFVNIFRKVLAEVSLSDLDRLSADVIDFDVLMEAGLLKAKNDGVKILGNGEISRAVTVRVNKVSKSAREAIEQAGGSIELIEPPVPILEVSLGKAVKRVKGDVVDHDALVKAGLVPEGSVRIRIVKRGSIREAKTFRGVEMSRQARRVVQAVGGKIED